MPEVPHTGENHREPQAIRSFDNLLVAYGSSRLNDRSRASPRDLFDPIGEREKRIRRRDRTLQWQNRFHSPDPAGVHPAHLSRTHPHRLPVARINDRIRLHMLANLPGKQ